MNRFKNVERNVVDHDKLQVTIEASFYIYGHISTLISSMLSREISSAAARLL